MTADPKEHLVICNLPTDTYHLRKMINFRSSINSPKINLLHISIDNHITNVRFEESSTALHFCTPLHFWILTSASAFSRLWCPMLCRPWETPTCILKECVEKADDISVLWKCFSFTNPLSLTGSLGVSRPQLVNSDRILKMGEKSYL